MAALPACMGVGDFKVRATERDHRENVADWCFDPGTSLPCGAAVLRKSTAGHGRASPPFPFGNRPLPGGAGQRVPSGTLLEVRIRAFNRSA